MAAVQARAGSPWAPADPLAWVASNLGWKLHPLAGPDDQGHDPGKRPLLWGWSKGRASSDPAQIAQWRTEYPGCNWGVVAGQSGLVVLDFDSAAAVEEFGRRFGPLPATVVVYTGRPSGCHLYFRCAGPKLADPQIAGLDLLQGAQQAVIPPSLHPSGRRYRFKPGHEPWAIDPTGLPQTIVAELLKAANEAPQRPTDGPKCVEAVAALRAAGKAPTAATGRAPAPVLRRSRFLPAGCVVRKGERNDTLHKHGCSLRSRGVRRSEIASQLAAANDAYCRPRLGSAEIAKIAASVCRHPKGAVGCALPTVTTLVALCLLRRARTDGCQLRECDGRIELRQGSRVLAVWSPPPERRAQELFRRGLNKRTSLDACRLWRSLAGLAWKQGLRATRGGSGTLHVYGGLGTLEDRAGIPRGRASALLAELAALQVGEWGPVLSRVESRQGPTGALLELEFGPALLPGMAKLVANVEPTNYWRHLLPVLALPELPSGIGRRHHADVCRLQLSLLARLRGSARTARGTAGRPRGLGEWLATGGWELEHYLERAAADAGCQMDRARAAVDYWGAQDDGWIVSLRGGRVRPGDPGWTELLQGANEAAQKKRREASLGL